MYSTNQYEGGLVLQSVLKLFKFFNIPCFKFFGYVIIESKEN